MALKLNLGYKAFYSYDSRCSNNFIDSFTADLRTVILSRYFPARHGVVAMMTVFSWMVRGTQTIGICYVLFSIPVWSDGNVLSTGFWHKMVRANVGVLSALF